MKRILQRIFRRLPSKLVVVLAAIAVTATVGVVAHATSGPSRTTKVYNGPGTPGFNYVTFDSFTNVPNIGNEENFFNGEYPGGTAFTDPVAQVQNGDELTLEVYVHNDADPSLNTATGQPGIARNTRVRVTLPSGTAKSQEATAYISADNAQPQVVYDTLDFSAANGGYFNLQYVPGTAHIRGNYIDQSISDNLVSSGDLIGTNALDGNVLGCFQQEVLVTFKVRVNMPEYRLLKQVRFMGQTSNDWKKQINANNGDTLQWSVSFTDNGSTELDQVTLLDQVPAGLDVVPGSVVLYNGNYPNGFTFPASAVQNNGRQINLNIGDYLPLSSNDQQAGQVSAQIVYATKVDETGDSVCNNQTLTNTAYATPHGFGAIFDTAQANVAASKKCAPPVTPPHTPKTPGTPTTLVNTGPGDVIALFGITTALGAVAHRLFQARRLANRG